MKRHPAPIVSILIVSLTALFVATTANAADPPTLQWIKQVGTPREEIFGKTAIDRLGHFFVAETRFRTAPGGADVLLYKYDVAGNLLWTRDVDSSGIYNKITAMWTDPDGNVTLSRDTEDAASACYLFKYDPTGNVIWSRALETIANRVVGEGLGNLYVCGTTRGSLAAANAGGEDAVLAKYDVNGDLLWMRQFGGASADNPTSVTPDGVGNVFVSGTTYSSLGGPQGGNGDLFLAKYDGAGNQLWLHQYGTPQFDTVGNLLADGEGNIYAQERLGGGWDDANHITKYDNNGTLLWSRQFGGTNFEDAFVGSVTDSRGNVYVSGQTARSLGGPYAGGASDAFVQKYSPEGEILWTFQLGTSQLDTSSSVAVDDLGNIVLAGYTSGGLAKPNAGGFDAWVALLRDSPSVPEPASIALLFAGMLALAGGPIRRWSPAR